MALANYKTIEVITEFRPTAVYDVWPGYDGCGGYLVTNPANNRTCPSPSTLSYEPERSVEWRPPKTTSGIRSSKFPRYRNTNYYVGRQYVRQYLTRRKSYASTGLRFFGQKGHVSKVVNTCTKIVDESYYQEGSATYWTVVRSFIGTPYIRSSFNEGDVNDACNAVMDNASREAFTSYDLLTEIAEAKDIPRLITESSGKFTKLYRAFSRRHLLSNVRKYSRVRPRDLLKSGIRAAREIGQDWMAYRYGVMPLVYSYQDVVKTVRRGVETSTRKSQTVSPTNTGTSMPTGVDYNFEQVTGSVKVSATIRQFFTWSEVAMVSSIGINPLVTAWELIPYSFVADWFVNVGDYICRRTSQSASNCVNACISQRRSLSSQKGRHFKSDDQTQTWVNDLPTGWLGSTPPAPPNLLISRPAEDQLTDETVTESYTRTVFDPGAAHLTLNPSLHWRRYIDSAVISLQLLQKLNRLLKG